MKIRIVASIVLSLTLLSCQEKSKLKYFPHVKVTKKEGKEVVDTVKKKNPQFSYTNQNGKTISQEDVKGKVFTADFFFTQCGSICPKTKKQMLRIQEAIGKDENFEFLSFTIDPKHDTPKVLKEYAEALGADLSRWHFLNGGKNAYKLANDFLIAAMVNKDAPGGIDHNDFVVLVDQEGYLRGAYKGTSEEEINILIADIKKLLKNGK